MSKAVNRIIDANINRAKEGLRVCEEITRFVLEDRALTAELKRLRHEIDALAKKLPAKAELIGGRNARQDIGQHIYAGELKRRDLRDIFLANLQRVKESVRVLEEFSKLTSGHLAVAFKKMRYGIYDVEMKISEKVCRLYRRR